jgi:predicted alpha/beta hydrolase
LSRNADGVGQGIGAYAPGVDPLTEYLDVGTDRLALHRYPVPADGASTVVLWPAMGVPARYYRRFAADLHACGLAVTVVDLRGTGASTPRSGRSSRYGFAELASDVGAVQRAVGEGPTVLIGHSLGGQACLLYAAAAADPTVAGIALVAVGLPYWRLYPRPRRYSVLAFTQTIGAATAALGVWPGWGFGGRQARRVVLDWAYTARRGRYPDAAVETTLRRLTTPVLAISVDDDRYTPAPTVDHLVGKLTAAPVERRHYTVAEAGAPLDHFTWVRAAKPLAARIATFVTDSVGRAQRLGAGDPDVE